MDLPKDPIMLLSIINMKLRDFYSDLDMLCQDLNISKDELVTKLSSVDYEYDKNTNQFV